MRRILSSALLLAGASTLVLGACRGSPTPLPPPPVASFGNEMAALEGEGSYGGVGAAGWSDQGPTLAALDAQGAGRGPGFGSTTYVPPSGPDPRTRTSAAPRSPAPPPRTDGRPYVVAEDAPVAEAPPPEFMGPGTTYGPPLYDAQPSPIVPPSGTRSVPAFEERPFRWHRVLEEAQFDAAAQGKLLMVVASRPGCTQCEQLMQQAVPARLRDVAAIAVGYTYDVTRPERRDLNQIVYANLPGAQSMPLVGFLDAGLGWLHGFWGGRSPAQLGAELANVRGLAPRIISPTMEVPYEPAAPYQPAMPYEAAPSPSGRAIAGGTPAGSGGTSLGGDGPRAPGPSDGQLEPWDRGWDELAPWDDGSLPPGGGAVPAGRGPSVPTEELAVLSVPPRETGGPRLAPALAAEAGPWGREALLSAYAQIAGKRYLAAQDTLAAISERMPGSGPAREAAKGGVAIYNAKRMDQAASGAEREQARARAERDLAGTLWAGLFAR